MLILRKKGIDLLSDFIRIYIASPYFIEQLNDKRTGSAQPQIPAGILKSFTINVPPLAEQHEIVKRVEELFKITDQVEGRYLQVKRHLNTIDQSILSKTFHGELVSQDPNDEPASVLLERIRQEKAREVARPKVKDKRKGKKMKHKQEEQRDILAVLRNSGQALTPEEVFSAAGFDEASVDTFYEQLREFIVSKKIREIREGETIRLEAIAP